MRKRFFFLLAVSLGLAHSATAQNTEKLRTYKLDTAVVVVGTRATEKTPVTVQNIKAKTLRERDFGQDLPALLSGTTSLSFTSDAGTGLGYTSVSLRGVDASRINITANGVPINDSESHNVFWVNMPNFVGSLDEIQVIRGAGVSTHGAGAFGGTINMNMQTPSALKAGGNFKLGYGAFNSRMGEFAVHTGRLLNNRLAASMRFSKIMSDGFVDRATVDLLSRHLQLAYFGDRGIYRLIHFGGQERTGIAWNGLSESQEKEHGRRYNSAGVIPAFEGGAVSFYPNTDNYRQEHTHFLATNLWGNGWKTEATLHYTRGKGYTDEYRTGRKLKEYGLQQYLDENGEKVKKRDLIREKWLDNHFFGGIFTLEKTAERYRFTSGLAANHYIGKHYGYRSSVREYPFPYSPHSPYYDNKSDKTDISAYLKAEWNLSPALTLYADYMFRHISYNMSGPTDKFNDITSAMDVLDVHPRFSFHLPKLGLTFSPLEGHHLYASVSTAAREPNRKAYTESPLRNKDGSIVYPKPEHLLDFELGYRLRTRHIAAELNAYYMQYRDQLVPDGRLSDVGELLLINVPKSYRAGLEMSVEFLLTQWLRYSANLNLSKNIIKEYTHTHAVYDENWEWQKNITETYKDTPIANSPSYIWNQALTAKMKAVTAVLRAHGQGKQYLDNTGIKDRVLQGFTVLSAQLDYEVVKLDKLSAVLSLQLNNILDKKYAAGAYLYDAGLQGAEGKQQYFKDIRSYPQAGRHLMSSLRIRF